MRTKGPTITINGDFVTMTVPNALYLALSGVMVKNGGSWTDACHTGAKLIEGGLEEIKRRAAEEARRLKNSTMMKEINTARETIRSNAYNNGFEDACEKFRVWYYCSVCGEGIWVEPNSNDHKAMIGYMKEHGWGHSGCHKKS